jgi:hypothetical protein
VIGLGSMGNGKSCSLIGPFYCSASTNSGCQFVALVALRHTSRTQTIFAAALLSRCSLSLLHNCRLFLAQFIGDIILVDIRDILHGFLTNRFGGDQLHISKPLVGVEALIFGYLAKALNLVP